MRGKGTDLTRRSTIFAMFGSLFPWSIGGGTRARAQDSNRTDANIVIAIDCSWSVNRFEFRLQLDGIVATLQHPEIMAAIEGGNRKAIGVILTQWSSEKSQVVAVPWTRIANAADASLFAKMVDVAPRLPVEGGTSISSALIHGQKALEHAPFRADRNVINLVVDGENNSGERIEPVRDRTIRRGTTINALGILGQFYWLHHYLANRVIGGSGAFVEQIDSYDDFAPAFHRKLLREINGQTLF